MRRTWTVAIGIIVGLAGLGNGAGAVSVADALKETERAFTCGGKPIHPALVGQFLTQASGKGYPVTVSVDVVAAFDTNEYFEGDVRKGDQGAILCNGADGQSEEGYRWFGRMADGTHVLCAWNKDKARAFPARVLFVRFSPGEGFLPDGKRYDRLLMNVVRWYDVLDARVAVTVAADSATISGTPPLLIKMLPNTPAPERPDIKTALNELDRALVYRGKPIHPGLIRQFIGSMADQGFPIGVSVDVAAAYGNKQYLADDVKEPEKGFFKVSMGEDGGFFAYRWLGRMADGTHVVQTFLNGGGSGTFCTLCFIRFSQGEGRDSDGTAYGRLLMTVLQTYPLSAEGGEAPIKVSPNQVTVGKTVVPPMEGSRRSQAPAGSAAPVATAGSTSKQAKVKADLLRVRETPSLEAAVVAKLPTGADIVVVESAPATAPWVRIKIPNSEATGWVHSDYIEYVGGTAQNKALSAEPKFVRVSVWKGDPKKEWLVDSGKPEQGKFCGVHGTFAAGTKFTVFAEGENTVYPATAKRTFQLDLPAGATFPVTELAFESGALPAKSVFLAFVGVAPPYEIIKKTAITAADEIAKVVNRVGAAVPDFKKLPYDWEGSGFSTSDTKSSAHALTVAGAPAVLATFLTPFKDQASNPGGHCETDVLLWSGRPFVCSPDGGTAPLFFRLGGKEYCWCNFESCSSGACTVELFECRNGDFVSVYTNDDFGT